MPADDAAGRDAAPEADASADAAADDTATADEMPAETDAAGAAETGDDADAAKPAATVQKPEGAKPAAEATATDEKPAKPAALPVGPKDGVQYSPEDVDRTLAELTAASEALSQATKDDMKKLKGQFYRKLYQLAEVTTFTPSMAAGAAVEKGSQQDVVRHALIGSAATPPKFAEVGKAAAMWLGASKGKEHQGIVLTGTVQKIVHRGKVFETTVMLTDDAGTLVTVLSPAAPTIGHGDSTLVWGSIVADPAQTLVGYAGTAPLAVWTSAVEAPPASALGTHKAASLKQRS
jgi:hypothetical protein